jgi:hypothetical protein
VRFAVDKLARGQVFLQLLRSSCQSSSTHDPYLFTFHPENGHLLSLIPQNHSSAPAGEFKQITNFTMSDSKARRAASVLRRLHDSESELHFTLNV